MNTNFFKPYPAYEDVFYDDIENHKKYFLPICSVNLKFMYPERDEWVHFISVKEIYEGCVGENTTKYHTKYTKEDMFGFDIIDGKYKFDASWDYFYINHNSDDSEELEIVYKENETSFEAGKMYFEKYGKIFYKSLDWENCSLKVLEDLEQKDRKQYPNYKPKYPEFFGFIDDIKNQSVEIKELMDKHNISLDEMNSCENTNLMEVPKDNQDIIFEYIGNLTGYSFQKHGGDVLYLFVNQEMKKAVICLEYT